VVVSRSVRADFNQLVRWSSVITSSLSLVASERRVCWLEPGQLSTFYSWRLVLTVASCHRQAGGLMAVQHVVPSEMSSAECQWCAKYYFQNSIIFWKYKIVFYFVFLKYSYQCILFQVFVIFKILFLKILSAKAKLKANLSVTEIRSF